LRLEKEEKNIGFVCGWGERVSEREGGGEKIAISMCTMITSAKASQIYAHFFASFRAHTLK
jgi:hypothetical protein